MRRRRRDMWSALLLVLALVAAACGGGTGTDTTAAPGAETTAAAPDTTAAVTETTAAVTETTAALTETTAGAAGEVATDVGVDDTTITLGLLADLTGIFAPLVQDIVAAQEVYWDIVNENGGIAGRQVELMIEDTNYNPEQHAQRYQALRDQVVALSQSTGSPHTASIVDQLQEDDMVAIALTWYSGWGIPEFDGGNVLEKGTNYCIEAMNVVSWLAEKHQADTGELPTLAIISFPGEYGQDSATGAKMAAEELGLEVVLDGEGQASIDPADPQTALITGLVQAQPDWVFATMSPSTAAVVMGGTVQDLQAQWTGAVPTYDFRLLDSPLADFISAAYWQPGYQVPWGTDVPGMEEVREAMLAARPDLRPSDAFITGWQEATIMEAVLRQAAENGDMTRAGIKAAALSLEGIDFQGLAPPQSYAGEPNDYVTREIAMFKPDKALYDEAGGAEQTLSSAPNGGTTGSQLVEDFFVSDVAAGFEFAAPCFVGG